MPVMIVGRQAEHQVLDVEARRQRPGRQRGVGVAEVRGIERQRAEKARLLLLVADAAIDDQLGAVPQRLGEAGGGVEALLVAVVERRNRFPCVGDELVEPDRRIDQASAGKADVLVVSGHGQKRREVRRV